MNDWQKRFTQKLETVRSVSSEQFEDVAADFFEPTFDDLQRFTAQQGLQAAAPLSKPGIRTFKFALAENAYVLITFRLAGLEACDAVSEFVVPSQGKLPPVDRQVGLDEVNESWSRRVFEEALDQFVDAYVESVNNRSKKAPVAAAV